MTLGELLSRFKPYKTFIHNPAGKTNKILEKLLFDKKSFNKKFNKVVIQSGELNAFTYNDPGYVINQWFNYWVNGGKFANTPVEMYSGPDIIYELFGNRKRNDIVDLYIKPVLSKETEAPLRVFHTARRYLIHSYRIGRYLLVFGHHDHLTTHSNYRNYLFNLEENPGLLEYCENDLNNGILAKVCPVKEVTTSTQLDTWFTPIPYTREEYIRKTGHKNLYGGICKNRSHPGNLTAAKMTAA